MERKKSLSFLTLPECYARGYFTKNDYSAKLKPTGFIGPVLGPHIVYHDRYPRVSLQQLELFQLRQVNWRESYLDGKRTAQYMGMPDTTNNTRANYYITRCVRTNGSYLSVKAPLPYSFKDTFGVYWHGKDLEMFSRFVLMLGRGELTEAHDTFDSEQGLWRPPYKMPMEDEYKDRYTNGTLHLIQNWRDMGEAELALYRRYKDGKPKRKKAHAEA